MANNTAGDHFSEEKQSFLYQLTRIFSAVPTSVVGPDVSFYQAGIDFVRMRTAGAKFVIVRAGQNNWPDPRFAVNWQLSKAAGLKRGSYWFYDSRRPPEDQADMWIQTMGGDLGELPLWADLEESYGGGYSGPYHWQKFIERLKRNAPGKEIGVYTAYGYWSSNCPAADRPYFAQYPLWVANYGVSSPRLPPGWSNWLFWQWTSTGDGTFYGVSSKGVDLNYFNGDLAAFQARYGGSAPPPVVDPPAEPKQKGVVLVGALNVRTGPGVSFPVMGGLFRDDVAYGNVDPATSWMRVSQVKRITGTQDSLDGWASALPEYMRVSAIEALPGTGDAMDPQSVSYPNGVRVIVDRLNGSLYRAVIVPPGAIRSAGMFKPDGCRLVENVAGDIVFNFASFSAPCQVNMGVRVNGVEYQIYDGLSQGSYAPFFWWSAEGKLMIDHRKTTWKTLSSALQGWRYLVENGIKNPRANAEWDLRNSRRCVGRLPDGSTVLLSVAGKGYLDSHGATFHECAELLIQLGCDYAIDGDGGGSTSDVIRYDDGSAEVFRGTAELRGVPAGGVIKLSVTLPAGMPGPEEPPVTGSAKPVRTQIQLDNGETWESTSFTQVQ